MSLTVMHHLLVAAAISFSGFVGSSDFHSLTVEFAWNRPRVPALPDERPTSVHRIPALERALRGFSGKKTEVVVNPAMGTVFDSLTEAYEFYNLYSWEYGFGIRYGKSRLNVSGSKCMQEIVCVCAVSVYVALVICWH